MPLPDPRLATSIARIFDWDVVLESIQSAAAGERFEPVELPEGAPPLRGRYGPKPSTSLQTQAMWSPEAVAVDSLLLNQAVPNAGSAWRVRISKTLKAIGIGPSEPVTITKYFRVDDADLTELGLTLLTLKPDRDEDRPAGEAPAVPLAPLPQPPRKF